MISSLTLILKSLATLARIFKQFVQRRNESKRFQERSKANALDKLQKMLSARRNARAAINNSNRMHADKYERKKLD